MRRAITQQGGQHIEGPGIQPVPAERGVQLLFHEPVRPGQPPEHLHRRDVQPGPLGGPLLDDAVNAVLVGSVLVGTVLVGTVLVWSMLVHPRWHDQYSRQSLSGELFWLSA